MFFVALGNTVGSNSIDGLLFAKMGTDWLPLLYIFAGLTTATVLSGNIVLLNRYPHVQLFGLLPLILAAILLVARLALLAQLAGLLPLLWLLKEVLYFVQMSFTWGVANLNTHPRQAKRIFPLFTAGNILGTVIGGFLTPALISYFAIDNMVLLWALLLLLAALIARHLLSNLQNGKSFAQSREKSSRPKAQRNIFKDLLAGFAHVRSSKLLVWVSFASIVLIICSNSLYLVFSQGAAKEYGDAAKLASFLSIIQAVSTTVALFLSLFFTNRLFARFGTMAAFLVYPAIFALGFLLYGLWPTFFVLTAFRLFQLTWSGGVTSAIWPTIFNVVPPERREVVSTFNRGISAQIGAILAGLFLMAAKRYLALEHVALCGMAAGLFGLMVVWKAKEAYGEALTDLLHHGNPEVFFNKEDPFGGFACHKEALNALLAGTKDKRAPLRRVAYEILGYIEGEDSTAALVEGIKDPRPFVRVAALAALTLKHERCGERAQQSKDFQAAMADTLQDKDKEVLLAALLLLAKSKQSYDEKLIKPLTNNKSKRIALLAAALCQKESFKDSLQSKDGNERALALWALAQTPDEELLPMVLSATHAKEPEVRACAARTLSAFSSDGVIAPLNELLGDKHISVRLAAGDALVNKEVSITKNLTIPERIDATLSAMDMQKTRGDENVEAFIKKAQEEALYYYEAATKCPLQERGERILAVSLLCQSRHWAVRCLRAIYVRERERVVQAALNNLDNKDLRLRGSALEALEASQERKTIRPLLPLFENKWHFCKESELQIENLLHDKDDWIRACSAWVCEPQYLDRISKLEKNDPSPFVRRVAIERLEKEEKMETLATLSLMEQIAFLRKMTLFSSLPPADLRDIAAVMGENIHPPGTHLAHEGERGEELYLIISGKVRVYKKGEDEKEHTLAICGSGEVVGDMALLSGEKRMASLVTEDEVRTLVLGRKAFSRMVRDKPNIGLAIIEVLCQRLRTCQLGEEIKTSEKAINTEEMANEMTWASFF